MNRIEFQTILESIKVPEGLSREVLLKKLEPINNFLSRTVPERLYKYRDCCETHISAFEKDELWMSTADLFNDPFDTLIQYDKAKLKTAYETLKAPNVFQTLARFLTEGEREDNRVPLVIDQDEKDRLRCMAAKAIEDDATKGVEINEFGDVKLLLDIYIKLLPEVVQRFSTIISFSEDIESILMWSHYSNNHKGFALGYDLRHLLLPNENQIGLYPVIYSDKRFNASEYFGYLLAHLMRIPDYHNPDMLGQIKLLLYKSLDWSYEREWRIIKSVCKNLFKGHAEPIVVNPNSIYYGCKISEKDYQRLHEIAITKGLEEHFMQIDDASSSYRMSVR